MFSKTFKKQIVALAATLAFAATASANVLVNGSFEDPAFAGGESQIDTGNGIGLDTGWTSFGAVFRIQGAADPVEPIGCTAGAPNCNATGAVDGSVALKAFGTSGVYQEFAATPGSIWNGTGFGINPANGDALTGAQIGTINIEWRDSNGDLISFDVGNNVDANSTLGTWIELGVGGVAPAGTATARFVAITGAFDGAGGGAPRWDDLTFQNVGQIPVPAAAWLFGSALAGLVAVRRRK